MKRNPFLLVTIHCLFILCLFTSLQGGQIKKTYSNKESLKLKAILGSCKIIKSNDNTIHIDVQYSFNENEYHAVFTELEDSLFLEEVFSVKDPVGTSAWIIAVPADIKLFLSSSTGNIVVEGVKSKIKAETGTGAVEINKSRGVFDIESGMGSVHGTDVVINGSSRFGSGMGQVYISIASSPDYNITVSSGMSDAILDYNGNPLKGCFEFIAKHGFGHIVSDVPFEKEEMTSDDHFQYDKKSFKVEDGNIPRIRIETGNGQAKLIN